MRFNPSKFTVGEQWNTNTGFTGGNNSDLGNMTAKSATSFDAGAGALYYNNNPSLKFSPYVGFSASHLTQPASDFYKGADNARMPIRYTVHGGLSINASPGLTVTPNFLYLSQGNAHETMVSAHAQIKAGNELDLLAGLNYRFNDAVVPVVGLDYKNFLIGLSYDVNTSDLGKTVSNVNSFEISLTYIFKKVRVLEEKRFTCPRL
jgi:type IX secretion system PorP/SprF family membrane protein